ncbi:hypothetical protein, partial [Dickeya dadantii]|uniref:hypothetical protein n=1 Tax=Dickeya dadantii TaxID=204038 RepID=UPI001C1318E0
SPSKLTLFHVVIANHDMSKIQDLSLSCVRCNGRETTPFIPHETIHLPEKIHRSKTTWLFVNSLSRPKAAIARMDNCC